MNNRACWTGDNYLSTAFKLAGQVWAQTEQQELLDCEHI